MRSASSGTTGSYRNAWQPESVRIIQKDLSPARRRSAVSRVLLLYQKMGFIASQYRNELNISDEFINICKQRKGSSKRYLVNDISEPAYARDWSLVYPKHIKEMKNGVMDDAAN